MKPPRLSASSIDRYEACPAGFKADYMQKRPPDTPSLPAMNGTACHEALEWFVQAMIATGQPSLVMLLARYEHAYWKLMPDASFLQDGREMLTNWYGRQNWDGRTVICTETRETFDLKVGPQEIVPITYIWDRGDSLYGGETIEVVDYKTVRAYVTVDQLRNRIQPKTYALAAKLKYPDAQHIKFTLDLLRYSPVSYTFEAEELREFYVYLRRMYARMLADDGSTETINGSCGYCIRRHACKALTSHVAAGGVMGLTDPLDIADRRRVIADHAKALGVMKGDLDEILLAYCEQEDILGFSTPNTIVELASKGTVAIDQERVRAVIGDAEAQALGYPKITATKLKKWLEKATHLDMATKSMLRQMMQKKYGAPYVKTTAKVSV